MLSLDVKSGPLETLPTIPGRALKGSQSLRQEGSPYPPPHSRPAPGREMEAGSRL